jgi:hypothetical protein
MRHVLFASIIAWSAGVHAQLEHITGTDAAAALRAALEKGSVAAVANLGRVDGFLGNPQVKIPLPESAQRAEHAMRRLGMGKYADELIVTMNRAAEQAVPEAAEILGGAIKQMSVADAKGILTGGTNAATLYFRRTSETNLFTKFLPIVQKATAQTGVTASYKQMTDRASGGLFGNVVKAQAPDIDGYVTQKAMDGLFLMISEEERRIRENPAARTTELLQKVFGAAAKK